MLARLPARHVVAAAWRPCCCRAFRASPVAARADGFLGPNKPRNIFDEGEGSQAPIASPAGEADPGKVVQANVMRMVDSLQFEPPGSSVYLDRLREAVSPADLMTSSLEQELKEEMAGALGRSGYKVDVAYLKCELAAKDVEALWAKARGGDDGGEAKTAHARAKAPMNMETKLSEAITAYTHQREEALAARRNLEVHRMAVGLRNTNNYVIVRKLYPDLPDLPGNLTHRDLAGVLGRPGAGARLPKLSRTASFMMEIDMFLEQHKMPTLFADLTAKGMAAGRHDPGPLPAMLMHVEELLQAQLGPDHSLPDAFATVASSATTSTTSPTEDLRVRIAAQRRKTRKGGLVRRTSVAGAVPAPSSPSGGADEAEDVAENVCVETVQRLLLRLHAERPAAPLAFLRDVLRQAMALHPCAEPLWLTDAAADRRKRLAYVAVVAAPAAAEKAHPAARDSTLTHAGRGAMFRLGAAVRRAFGHITDAEVGSRSLRENVCLHSAEGFLHGALGVRPQPTRQSRARMSERYTTGFKAVKYIVPLCTKHTQVSTVPTVEIVSTRLPPDTDEMLGGTGSDPGPLLDLIRTQLVEASDASPDADPKELLWSHPPDGLGLGLRATTDEIVDGQPRRVNLFVGSSDLVRATAEALGVEMPARVIGAAAAARPPVSTVAPLLSETEAAVSDAAAGGEVLVISALRMGTGTTRTNARAGTATAPGKESREDEAAGCPSHELHIDGLKVGELRSRLKAVGKSSTGKKAELQERLRAAMAADASAGTHDDAQDDEELEVVVSTGIGAAAIADVSSGMVVPGKGLQQIILRGADAESLLASLVQQEERRHC